MSITAPTIPTATVFPHPAAGDFIARARRQLELDRITASAVADFGAPPGGPWLVLALLAAMGVALITGDLDDARRPRRGDARGAIARLLKNRVGMRRVAP